MRSRNTCVSGIHQHLQRGRGLTVRSRATPALQQGHGDCASSTARQQDKPKATHVWRGPSSAGAHCGPWPWPTGLRNHLPATSQPQHDQPRPAELATQLRIRGPSADAPPAKQLRPRLRNVCVGSKHHSGVLQAALRGTMAGCPPQSPIDGCPARPAEPNPTFNETLAPASMKPLRPRTPATAQGAQCTVAPTVLVHILNSHFSGRQADGVVSN